MIKAKEGVALLVQAKTGRVHVAHGPFLCGTTLSEPGVLIDTCEESEMCSNCLRIARKRGLIEEVEDQVLPAEHHPPPPEDMTLQGPFTSKECQGKVVPKRARVWNNPSWEHSGLIGKEPCPFCYYAIPEGTSMTPEHPKVTCEECDGTGFYGDNGPGIIGNCEYHACECGAENAMYTSLAEADDKATRGWDHLKAIWEAMEFGYDWEYGGFLARHVVGKYEEMKKRIKELEADVELLEGKSIGVNSWVASLSDPNTVYCLMLRGTLGTPGELSLLNLCPETKAKVAELEAANDELNEDDAKQTKLLCDYDRATAGHTLANVTLIMKHILVEELAGGLTLEFRLPKAGDEWLYIDGYQRVWRKSLVDWECNMLPKFIRTPKVEWLEGGLFGNSLIRSQRAHMPCQFKEGTKSDWEKGTLLARLDHELTPFAVLGTDNLLVAAVECRIKKSDIKDQ